jgi:DNA repair protein SbcD/Mre11
MKPFRFLHAADLHMDSPFKGLTELPPAIRETIRESTYHTLQKLVQLAIQQRVDLVLISGDVYDAADRSLRAQLRFQRAVQRLAEAGIQVFLIHGNHDPLDGRVAQLKWPDHVHVFDTDRVGTIQVTLPGKGIVAEVHGVSYGQAAVTDNWAVRFRAGDKSKYQIGMLHTNVDGDAAHDNYAPCTKGDLLNSQMHYWALGHIHTRHVVYGNEGVNNGQLIVYPGNTQGRSVRETGAKGCYIADVVETGETHLHFHTLDSVRWRVESIAMEELRTEQELKDELEQRMNVLRIAADGRPVIVRFLLEGRGPLHEVLSKGRAVEDLTAMLREEQLSALRHLPSTMADSSAVHLDRHETVQGDYEWDAYDSAESPWVWVESIENRTRKEIDRELLLTQQGFIGDLLRLSESLLKDEAALAVFADEANSAIKAHPQAAKLLEAGGFAELRRRLEAAESLCVDALIGEGGRIG